jgi:Cu2+-exporting ATPase
MLTGEAEPEPVKAGGRAFAGTLNLTGPLTLKVTARAGDTLLAEIVRLMEAAESSSSRYVRLADRVSRAYAPFVHIVALLTVIGWLLVGSGWHMALTTAVAVLIITCPCALGLAVPAVQVVAGGFLLGRGIMVKDGGALERLAAIDTVVFDKTGTLTEGEPRLAQSPAATPTEWALAAALGAQSRHPLARALARAAGQPGAVQPALDDIAEHPGDGMEARLGGRVVRLGRRDFVGGGTNGEAAGGSEIWLRIGEDAPLRFGFEDTLRLDAADTIAALEAAGLDVILLSGDRREAVARVALLAGIGTCHAGMRPGDKAALLADLAAKGRRVLMVGDGLNDAPALASAFVSMSPANAADISQAAADIVFTGRMLAPVTLTLSVAHRARALIRQNFVLAIGYNLIAVPVAILGFATPLIAAIAMSTSSIIVTANALKLPFLVRRKARMPAQAPLAALNPAEQTA